jgi:hypothetical protein
MNVRIHTYIHVWGDHSNWILGRYNMCTGFADVSRILSVFPKTQKHFLQQLSGSGMGLPRFSGSDEGFALPALVSEEGFARPPASAYLGKTV